MAGGFVRPSDAWPEFFGRPEGEEGFPVAGADMDEFALEEGASIESVAADLAAMGASVKIGEDSDPLPAGIPSPVPDLEWT